MFTGDRKMKTISILYRSIVMVMLLLGGAHVWAHTENDPLKVELIAAGGGSGIKVGYVDVWNDKNDIQVTFRITDSAWCLNELHLHITTSEDLIPQTKGGNPIPGRFDYSEKLGCVDKHSIKVPLVGLPPQTKLFIAAHAKVGESNPINPESQLEETAWGAGTNFIGNNWGTYFNYEYKDPRDHRAMLGPLSGALVEVFSLRDLETILHTTFTNEEGYFLIPEEALANIEFFLVRVSGGNDTDANQDGVKDAIQTVNEGSIHAIVTREELLGASINVTTLSDMAWRYIRQQLDELSFNDLHFRLNQLAVKLIGSDISGDGKINYLDLNQFSSIDVDHLEKLNYNYQIVFKVNVDGNSIIAAYHDGNDDLLQALLEDYFSGRLSFFYAKNPLSNDVRVKVVKFGHGSVNDTSGKLILNAVGPNKVDADFAFFEKSSNSLVITAQGTPDTDILDWNGCDKISDDKTTCSVSLLEDREIIVSFGYKEAIVVDNLVDLSRARVVFEGDDVMHVTINHGDDEMIDEVSNLAAGDFVVGEAGDGFLRKLVSISKTSLYKYTLITTQASINEIIKQGTLSFSKTFTNDDLDLNLITSSNEQFVSQSLVQSLSVDKDYQVTPASPVESAKIPFSDIPGISLIKSDNPEDETFVIQFGSNADTELTGLADSQLVQASDGLPDGIGGSIEDEVVLYSKNGVDLIKASGKVEVTLKVDFGASWGGFFDLEYFKVVPTITATEDLELFVGGEVDIPVEETQKIGTIVLKTITAFIGPVPVYIKPVVEFYLGFDGKVTATMSTGIELEQLIRAGVVFHSGEGINRIGEISPSWDFKEPALEGAVFMRGFVRPDFIIKLYGVTGPGIPVDGYIKLKAEQIDFDTNPDVWKNNRCFGGIDFSAWLGIDAKMKWHLDDDTGISILDKFLNEKLSVDKVKVQLLKKEWFLLKGNLLGICDDSKIPPLMSIAGVGIYETVIQGSVDVITKQYVITNDGGVQLDWSIDFIEDEIVSVDKKSGKIDPKASDIVTVTVNPQNLAIGNYKNTIRFKNNYDFNIFTDYESGNTIRSVAIEVIPSQHDAPFNFIAEMFSPTIVSLSWDYPSTGYSANTIEGYTVFVSEDGGNNYVVLADIAVPTYFNQLLVENMLTDKTYYFAIDAYSGFVRSNVAYTSIYIPPIEPEGDCRAHFSGALMNDHFITGWTSEAYVIDAYSEYVGAGRYPSNNAAFPKAVSTTFDGIAIDKGTKVTIYSGNDFTGSVLYEKVGPAIINNSIYEGASQAASIMEVWKEPLQSNFPLSVRSWSQSNMHTWSTGSLIVECGYDEQL